jgi:hypothetical protein
MARHIMTARRKAALRKAQLASARKRFHKRRGSGKAARKALYKTLRKNPKKLGRFGAAIILGGVAGTLMGKAIDRPAQNAVHKYRSRFM